jgi:hypothetical protein
MTIDEVRQQRLAAIEIECQRIAEDMADQGADEEAIAESVACFRQAAIEGFDKGLTDAIELFKMLIAEPKVTGPIACSTSTRH